MPAPFALSDRSSYLLRQLQQVFQEAAQFLVLNRSVIILSYKERIVINTTSSGRMFSGSNTCEIGGVTSAKIMRVGETERKSEENLFDLNFKLGA